MNIIAPHLTPMTHGYVVCSHCGTWRPKSETMTLPAEGTEREGAVRCADTAFCAKAEKPKLPGKAKFNVEHD